MRSPTLDDGALLDRLTDVFRQHGFEGATLSRIAEATGLKRASLYHRFPGGKDEMAAAVLARIDEAFATDVLAPLAGPGDVEHRLRAVARRLGAFYDGGARSCVLDTLSLGESGSGLAERVRRSFTAWLDAFAHVARESGRSPAAARRWAEDSVMSIQGALVLARATGSRKPFERLLRALPETLAEAAVD